MVRMRNERYGPEWGPADPNHPEWSGPPARPYWPWLSTLRWVLVLICAWGAFWAAALALLHAVTLGRAGSELGAALLLACIALVLDWPPYEGGPRDLPGAPRAGIDTQE